MTPLIIALSIDQKVSTCANPRPMRPGLLYGISKLELTHRDFVSRYHHSLLFWTTRYEPVTKVVARVLC